MTNTSSIASPASLGNPDESDHRWEPSAWMIEPGANSEPLTPGTTGLVKTLPTSDISVFDGPLLPLREDITAVNNTYIELTNGLAGNKWIAVLGAILFVIPMTFALLVGLIWSFFEPHVLASFFESPGATLGTIVILILLVAAGLPMGYCLFTSAFFSPEDEPIRFCRRDRKVYRYKAPRWHYMGMDIYRLGKPEIKVYDWENCRAEVVRVIVTSGKTVRRDCFLQLAVTASYAKTVQERFTIGSRDVFSDFTRRILLWETVRRFMEEGADKVPPAMPNPHRGNMIDCMDEFNPFALPSKSHPGAQRLISYPFALLLWLTTPFLLTAPLFRWIGIKASRKVDWGWLDEEPLRIEPDDPALQRPKHAEESTDPAVWKKELKQRRDLAMLWLISAVVYYFILAYLGSWPPFSKPEYYRECPANPDGTRDYSKECRWILVE